MNNFKTSLLIAAAVAGYAQISNAAPTQPGIYLYDEATGASQFVQRTGMSASYSGAVGDYTVVISATGITMAGGVNPVLYLDIAQAVAGAGATKLDVYYSDGTFGPSAAPYTLTTFGPASGGPVVTSAYWDSTVFGTTYSLGGSTDVYPSTVNAAGTLIADNYYLTLQDTITGNALSLDSEFSVVPEPATFVAGALLLVPLGISIGRILRKHRAINQMS